MSNSVTTAIRDSVRDMAIGKTKSSEKADRATVEQVIASFLFVLFLVSCSNNLYCLSWLIFYVV